ncbi:MAG: hypothetical protein V4722_03150 [Bacteroidota bacterium]
MNEHYRTETINYKDYAGDGILKQITREAKEFLKRFEKHILSAHPPAVAQEPLHVTTGLSDDF